MQRKNRSEDFNGGNLVELNLQVSECENYVKRQGFGQDELNHDYCHGRMVGKKSREGRKTNARYLLC